MLNANYVLQIVQSKRGRQEIRDGKPVMEKALAKRLHSALLSKGKGMVRISPG